ncbi:PAS domain-containing protein [Planctomycetota bacterium]
MGEPLRVLIVEDNEDDALLLIRTLEKGGFEPSYVCVDTAEGVQQALDEVWDIVIADYSMPQFCGLEALQLLQMRKMDVPFILVSGTIGEEVAVEAMRAGAHDYIMKEHLALIPPAVKRELHEARNRRQHHRAEERFRVVSEITTDIIYEWDLEKDRIAWYGGFDEALGYKAGEIPRTSDGWLQLIHTEDRARVEAMHDRRRNVTHSLYENYRIRRKNGQWLHWLDRGAPILNRGGEPVRWVGGCSDVTETKRSERRLADYQMRLKSLTSELSLAEERERRRVAEGVHDNICQRLALTKFELQSLQHTLADVGLIRQLERVCQSVDQIIEEAHTLTFELSNPVLYEVGLDAAVESWLGQNVQGKYGIEYEFTSQLCGFKPNEVVLVFLFQSIRELVTNVVKHAHAQNLKIDIVLSEQTIRVHVNDDGVGLDADALEFTDAGGFGLFSVRERLEYMGGSLEVEAKPNAGTRVTLVVPDAGQPLTSHSTLASGTE